MAASTKSNPRDTFASVLNDLQSRGLLDRARKVVCGDVAVELVGPPGKDRPESPEALQKRLEELMYGGS